MNQRVIYRPFLICIGILFLILFFLGRATLLPTRSFMHLWDSGHIAAFFLWTFLALQYVQEKKKILPITLAGWTLASALTLSLTIEYLQSFSPHRIFDEGDIVKNLIGSVAALIFTIDLRQSVSNGILRLFKAIILFLIALCLIPLVKAFSDECIARYRFPILSNFETPFESSRFKGNAIRKRSSEKVFKGRYALKVTFTPKRYSTLYLKFFPRDWKAYSKLSFSIRNEAEEPMTLILRINDMNHLKGPQSYNDRFNQSVQVQKGWQTITILLKKVKEAPKTRAMDLSRIESFGMFMVDPKSDHTIFIDEIKLLKE